MPPNQAYLGAFMPHAGGGYTQPTHLFVPSRASQTFHPSSLSPAGNGGTPHLHVPSPAARIGPTQTIVANPNIHGQPVMSATGILKT
jgi:hypothetical protein